VEVRTVITSKLNDFQSKFLPYFKIGLSRARACSTKAWIDVVTDARRGCSDSCWVEVDWPPKLVSIIF